MLWIVAAGIGAVALLGTAIGLALPRTREGQAQAMIAAPPGRVRAVLEDVAAQPAWRPGIAAVEMTPGGWTEVTARGERIRFARDPAGLGEMRLRFASSAGYSGTWQARLVAEGAGTRIEVRERAEVPNPLRRLAARVLFDPQAFAAAYLAALKARAEGG
jgi:hypothetical protein